jgi:hypothetical protein
MVLLNPAVAFLAENDVSLRGWNARSDFYCFPVESAEAAGRARASAIH